MVAHDRSAVAARYANCAALRLSKTGCPFGPVATTSDGSGGLLYGILLTAQTGDDCYRGVAYFFDGERLLASTEGLPPYSVGGGVVALRASGPKRFAVGYGVSPSSQTSCAQNGSAGTDTYRYSWNGSALSVVSGTLPSPPEVIVGYEGPLAVTASGTPDHVAVCPRVAPNSCAGYPSSSSVIYSIVVRNTGTVRLPTVGSSGVRLTVLVPGYISYLDGNFARTNPDRAHIACRLSPHGNLEHQVICDLGALPSGSVMIATVTGTVTGRPPGDQFVVTATAAAASQSRTVTESSSVVTQVG